MRIRLRHLPFLLSLFFSVASRAQTITAPVSKAPDYSKESFVVEKVESRTVMAADGTGFVERSIRVRIQSEAALRDFGVLSLGFAGASQKVEIEYVRVHRPDGTVLETSPADALEQPEPVTREAPFYSDLKDKQLPIKSLRVGDTLEWKARIVRTKPEAPGNFWGQESFTTEAIILSESFELRVPKSVAVNVWTNPRLNLKPNESDEGADHIYRWENASLKATTGPEAEAAKAEKKKKLLTADEELDAREGVLPSIAWSTFKTWPAVGVWYRSLESGRIVPDDQIKAKVAELTAGKTTDEEKVRAVYGFVAPQIRYIGVAFGVGRYQPHLASEVLENQYGDCKDKHTLLAAMLTALGLHPDAVLIGEGIRFNEAVPSPAAFNHLITHVTVAGQPVWLDATAEVAPYRVLGYDLRDKPSLVVPETGDPRIEHTPAELPFPSTQTWKAVGSLDKEGVSNSRITFTVRGDDELVFRQVLRQVPPANYPQLIQKISESMGYGGTASNPSFSPADDTAEPLVMSYDYKREQGGDWENRKIIPQVHYNSLPLIDEKEPPIASVQLGWPRTELSTAEMKLPDGWGVVLPEATHATSDFATVDETYRFQKGVVYVELKVAVLKKEIPVADWKKYKKWTEDAGLTNQVYIQLTHAKASASMDAPALDSLRAWAVAAPDDPTPVTTLVNKLLEENNSADALEAANKGVAALPEANRNDPKLQLALGKAQMAAGSETNGVATLAALLKTSDDPLILNDAAYELSKAFKELPLAEASSRKALDKLAVESGSWTLDESPGTLRQQTSLIIASWDTLGWILYREGKYDEALDLVRAAFINSGRREEGEHLGDIQDRLARHQDALRSYELALSTLPGGAKSTSAVAKQLEDKIDAQRRQGAKADKIDTTNELMRQRSLSLGAAAGRQGEAEYRVLIAHGRVEKAQPTGQKSLPAGDELILKADAGHLTPGNSNAKLSKQAILNCHSGTCDLIFEP